MMLWSASTAGALFSLSAVMLLRPAPPAPWRWERRGLALHAGIWLVLHALLALVLGRPWFAAATGIALVMLIVQVSNAKFHSLREPFVFQDFEYFTDAIRHPRLYIPFLGWWKFIAIVCAAGAALAVGLWLEAAPPGRFAIGGLLGEMVCMAGIGALILAFCGRNADPACQPEEDLARLGLFGSLWDYGWAERRPLRLPGGIRKEVAPEEEKPDLIVVQSESFFDPRSLLAGIRPEVLAEFDRLRAAASSQGALRVPAWGANTVRSEFAFLSAADEKELGVHRFNPYRRILDGEVTTLASVLKSAGYRTVCVHPYPASFYRRDRVYPFLGFDEFIDIRDFSGAERFGPYVADAAVADKIESVLKAAAGPVFIFAITMENHGPLHLEQPAEDDYPALYHANPPAGCEDLTVYLRHLRNADRMLGRLRASLSLHRRPARLCWYGDHVPIMAGVYQALGMPEGHTEYLIWDNCRQGEGTRQDLDLHRLANALLSA